MPQVHEIDGVGLVEFPDDATQEEVQAALNEQFQQEPLESEPTAGERAQEYERKAASLSRKAKIFGVAEKAAELGFPPAYPRIASQGMRGTQEFLNELLNPGRKLPSTEELVSPVVEKYGPRVFESPFVSPEVSRGIGKGAIESAAGLAVGLPEALPLIAAGPASPVVATTTAAAFARDMLASGIDQAKAAVQAYRSGDKETAARSGVGAASSILMSSGIMAPPILRTALEKIAPPRQAPLVPKGQQIRAEDITTPREEVAAQTVPAARVVAAGESVARGSEAVGAVGPQMTAAYAQARQSAETAMAQVREALTKARGTPTGATVPEAGAGVAAAGARPGEAAAEMAAGVETRLAGGAAAPSQASAEAMARAQAALGRVERDLAEAADAPSVVPRILEGTQELIASLNDLQKAGLAPVLRSQQEPAREPVPSTPAPPPLAETGLAVEAAKPAVTEPTATPSVAAPPITPTTTEAKLRQEEVQNALAEQKTSQISLQPTPGDSQTVAEGVRPPVEKPAAAKAEEKAQVEPGQGGVPYYRKLGEQDALDPARKRMRSVPNNFKLAYVDGWYASKKAVSEPAPSEPATATTAAAKAEAPEVAPPAPIKEVTPSAKEVPKEETVAPEAPAAPAVAAPIAKAEAKIESEVRDVARTEGKRPAKEVKDELVSRLEKAIEDAQFTTEEYFPGLYVKEARTLAETTVLTDIAGEGTKPLATWLKDPWKKNVPARERKPNSSTAMGQRFIAEALQRKGVRKITINIPGDGNFTIWNTKDALQTVLERAKKIKLTTSEPASFTKTSMPGPAARKRIVEESRAEKPEGPAPPSVGPGAQAAGPIGMGGAVPSEFVTSGRTQTSIKNAVVDRERVERGEKPMMDVIRRGREEVWQHAMAVLDRDPMAREKLVAELNQKPRAINDYEVALLDHYRVDLKNEYAKATREAAQAVDDGRIEDVDRLNAITNDWSDKLLKLETAAGKGGAGTETARGLAFRRQMVNDDFTLANLEMEKRRANGFRQLTPDERAQLKKQADEHKAKADAYEKRIADLERERDAQEIKAALAKEKRESEHPPLVIEIAEKIVASWDKRADAARARIRERMSRMSAGVDPTVILDLAEIGLSHAGHAVLNVAKFGEKLTAEFGDWVKPHVGAAWQKLQELIEKEKGGAKPGSPRAKAIEKITTQPADPIGKAKAKIRSRLNKEGDGDISFFVRRIARHFVQQGVNDLNVLVDRVHEVLLEIIPDITRRETMDAISGYGRFKPLPKDAVSVILRDLSGQAQQIAKLEDMASGVAPSKTGLERRSPSDVERILIKQVEEAKKRGGYEVTDPETQLRSAMQTVHTRLQNQITDLETQIANRAKIIKEPSKLVYDQKANELKARRDELMEQFRAMFPKEPITEAQRLARWKEHVVERTAELKSKLAAGDFSKPQRRPPVQLDQEALRLRFDMHTIERQILEGRAADMRRKQNGVQKGLRYAGEILNTFRAMKTSFDLSAVLRQGGFIGFGHPIRSAQSFPSMFKALMSEQGAFKVAEEIRMRENAPMYEQAKLYLAEHGGRLSRQEEAYMSRWAEHIPGVRASGRAYVAFLNKLRADSFDAMAATLVPNGRPTIAQAQIIANFINVATGRGSVALDQAAVALNTAFFAPRYVASRFQTLVGQPLWGGGPVKGQGAVRKLIAKEYARTLIGASVVFGLGLAAGGIVETDPTSSEFGKIRFGRTRIDPLFGLNQTMVFSSRMAASLGRALKALATGQAYRGNAAKVIWNFIRSKFSPAVGETVNVLTGTDVASQPVTLKSLPSRLIEPIGINDIRKEAVEMGAPAGTVIAGLSLLGMGVQTYGQKGPEGDIYRLLGKWKQASEDPKIKAEVEKAAFEVHTPSDYDPLRSALEDEDYGEARRQYTKLLETKSRADIRKAMNPRNAEGKFEPISGSATVEARFLRSLDDAQMAIYRKAQIQRLQRYRRFENMFREK